MALPAMPRSTQTVWGRFGQRIGADHHSYSVNDIDDAGNAPTEHIGKATNQYLIGPSYSRCVRVCLAFWIGSLRS